MTTDAPWRVWARRIEDGLAAAAILVMAVLPVLEMLLRGIFKTGIPGSSAIVQNLTLWVGFIGAMIASREKKHLSLAAGVDWMNPRAKRIVTTATAAISAGVAAGLAWASFQFVRSETEATARIAGWLPIWIAESILPAAFAVIALRFVWNAEGWIARGVALLGIPAAAAVGFLFAALPAVILWPGILLLVAAAALGAPIFVAMGGAALLLFHADGTPAASIPVEIYRLVVSPSIPTIPLFTLAGFILAEGKAGQRLLRLAKALFGWMPGGLAIVTTLVCAFFTTFTGASGVTILALGGLLLPMLLQSGYSEKFSIGLVTSSGSIGALFPPSLPVILYGVAAHVPIPDLYRAGALPGALLVLSIAILGVIEAKRSRVPRQAFDLREAGLAFWEAKWEVLLPVVALVALFGGFCTLIEAAAITVVYALLSQSVIHRDLHPVRDLPRALSSSVVLVGGVMAILGVAMGLTNYMVDAEVPMHASDWVRAHVGSRFTFLLALNLFLILVGAMMDIYSAIMVIVPLILPASAAFGIDPTHLGIIFLSNLQLGYLLPPVGENLFLASYKFDRPVLRVAAYCLPFVAAILAAVLIITYAPGLALVGS